MTLWHSGPRDTGVRDLSERRQLGLLSSRRYRNFRTFTSPRPTQFSCVAVDSSGEIVSAGAQDSFEIFIWSMQTGRLLEVRGGHHRCGKDTPEGVRGPEATAEPSFLASPPAFLLIPRPGALGGVTFSSHSTCPGLPPTFPSLRPPL